MAIIVEDGTEVAGAESYVAVAEVDSFAVDRNDTGWAAASPAVKEAAIRVAAEYLDTTYNWKGFAVTKTQEMEWPRSGAVDRNDYSIDSDEIPAQIQTAQMHLALEEFNNGPILPSVARGGEIKRLREEVDVIETETEYKDSAPAHRRFPTVDRIVKGLHKGGQLRLVRA